MFDFIRRAFAAFKASKAAVRETLIEKDYDWYASVKHGECTQEEADVAVRSYHRPLSVLSLRLRCLIEAYSTEGDWAVVRKVIAILDKDGDEHGCAAMLSAALPRSKSR